MKPINFRKIWSFVVVVEEGEKKEREILLLDLSCVNGKLLRHFTIKTTYCIIDVNWKSYVLALF